MTLEEYNTQFLGRITKEELINRVVADIGRPNPLAELLTRDIEPPTRWQRFKNRLADWKQRAKDIWTILRGGDIHENCGW